MSTPAFSTPEDLVALLHQSEYPLRIPRGILESSKTKGLVIVTGESDDLMGFQGAIRNEIGAYGGGSAWVDARGLLPNRQDIEDDETLRDFFSRMATAHEIRALWCPDDTCSWAIETEIPHAKFEVMEDGEVFCKGIVFSLNQLL